MSFQVGDIVYDVLYGESVVHAIDGEDSLYPVVVFFCNKAVMRCYTKDGYEDIDRQINQALFHRDGYRPPIDGREPARFKKGDPVWVSNVGENSWSPRIFSHAEGNNTYVCFYKCGDGNNEVKFRAWHLHQMA